ncbi:MAG: hypothetical protein KIS91_16765, partial [Anaerolineae bacterium]|nr:hypothetical protein [Anaerolineae bacterium]
APAATSGDGDVPESASNRWPAPSARTGDTQSVSTATQDRYWRDAQGIHRATPDGHAYLLTPPPIGGASLDGWTNSMRQHPNETPYLLYVDGQYSDVVWIPQATPSSNIQMDVQPSISTRQSVARPSGDGDSTDPREVALDALGHVPLPAIHLQVNPALGLVHMPGWFWVEGYDGRPFGLERRVTVPPEVGDDVPITVVPADDPRRRETHFTVQVRLWASRYEWNFGDGQGLLTMSLGKPMPAESDIQHTYEYSSLGLPEGFPVRLTVTFDAEYRVNGGPPIGLPSIQQTYEYGYRVQEIQSILTQR